MIGITPPLVQPQGQIAFLLAEQLVAHLALGIDDRDLAAAFLDKDNADNGDQKDCQQQQDATDGAAIGTGQADGLSEGTGQSGNNVDEDQERRATSHPFLRDHLSQPHHKHGSCRQSQGGGGHEGQLIGGTGKLPHPKGNANALDDGPAQGDIAGVLRNLPPPLFSLVFLQVL
jgi:hypothetical protein